MLAVRDLTALGGHERRPPADAAGYERLRDAAPLHLAGVVEHMMRHVRPEELPTVGAVLARIADAHRLPRHPERKPD